jgi:MYXO-CTERM domain-containing protein
MTSAIKCVVVAGLTAAIASTASANLTTTYLGTGYGKFQSVSYNPSAQWDQAGSGPFYSVKAFDHNWQDVGTGATWTGWCIQLYQGITVGNQYTFNCVDLELAPQAPPAPGPMGTLQANLMRDLFSRWIDTNTGTVAVEGSLAATNAKAAAFAIAIWEITHENFTGGDLDTIKSQMSLTNGAHRANLSADVAGWYNQIFASLGSGGWQTTFVEGLVNSVAQDQARIPAPGAIALLGLAGLAGRRRRN